MGPLKQSVNFQWHLERQSVQQANRVVLNSFFVVKTETTKNTLSSFTEIGLFTVSLVPIRHNGFLR